MVNFDSGWTEEEVTCIRFRRMACNCVKKKDLHSRCQWLSNAKTCTVMADVSGRKTLPLLLYRYASGKGLYRQLEI